jgi:hypothetical protein
LQEVQGLQQLVLGLVDQFDKQLNIQLDHRQINGGILGEARMIELIRQGTLELKSAINEVGANSRRAAEELGGVSNTHEPNHLPGVAIMTRQQYVLHMHDGKFHVVPKTWRFPCLGPFDMWLHWWLGDGQLNIPPLKILQGKEFLHLDGKVGHDCIKQLRKACKTLADLKFLMTYLETNVGEQGYWVEHHTVATVVAMYHTVAHLLVVCDDFSHHHH